MTPAPVAPEREATAHIRRRALELGFSSVGIAAIAPTEAAARYEAWLAAGRHGTMDWLATPRHRGRRADPARILPGVRSVVCVTLAYDPAVDPARDLRLGRIARYAAGDDYHLVMDDLLGRLEREMAELLPGSRPLWYADTGAILEREWARRAGLGWIAKNTCVIAPRLGSYVLLGEVLVDRELVPDLPFASEHCGSCHACIDACPTRAIVAPHELDARRCISYLTIELRGPIPRELRPLVGDWVFGCDVCQDVCPWNRFAAPAHDARLHARTLDGWTLERFLGLDEPAFEALFAGSPIRRARRGGFVRNVCVALGNRGDDAALPALGHTLATDADEVVRGHAAWATGAIAARLAPGAARDAALAALRAAAADASAFVRDEVSAALPAAGA